MTKAESHFSSLPLPLHPPLSLKVEQQMEGWKHFLKKRVTAWIPLPPFLHQCTCIADLCALTCWPLTPPTRSSIASLLWLMCLLYVPSLFYLPPSPPSLFCPSVATVAMVLLLLPVNLPSVSLSLATLARFKSITQFKTWQNRYYLILCDVITVNRAD